MQLFLFVNLHHGGEGLFVLAVSLLPSVLSGIIGILMEGFDEEMETIIRKY